MFTLVKIFPGLPETERGRPFCLKSDPTGKKIIYGIANSVIIRDVDDPLISEIITNHSKKVTSVSYTPSGYYICSGDITGSIKIWDTTNVEHSVKYEFQPLMSTIYDISWSEDSKRICVVGDGREKYGSVISWDTGTNIGGITGHVKACLSCDFKKTRPFAIITGGEDMAMVHHKGPPFKYDKTHRIHTNFINCVRYNHDGSLAASASLDGKIAVFDGKTMDFKHELEDEEKKAHKGGVYSISWSPCGKKLLSASADKTCKIWDAENNKVETVFKMGTEINDQQLACLWMKDHLISISMSGKINFLNASNPDTLKKIYWGHNKGIISAALSQDHTTLITASYDGCLNHWDIDTGICTQFTDSKISAPITAIDVKNDTFIVAVVGKIVQFGCVSLMKFYPETLSVSNEPKSIVMVDDNTAIVGCLNSLELIKDRKIVDVLELKYHAESVKNYDGNTKLVVCGSDGKVRFYSICGDKLVVENKEINIGTPLSNVTVSHDGKQFLFGAASKYAYVYDVETLQQLTSWMAQANRVNWVDYSSDDQYVATCGVDGAVNIYKPADRSFRIELRQAHRSYNTSVVFWLSSTTVVSIGQQDCTIKFWQLKL